MQGENYKFDNKIAFKVRKLVCFLIKLQTDHYLKLLYLTFA